MGDMQAKSPKKAVQKTWSNRFAAKRYPKRVTLDADFAGIPAGSTLFVGTPQILQTYIHKIPIGETRTIHRLRRDIARANHCEAMCPRFNRHLPAHSCGGCLGRPSCRQGCARNNAFLACH